MDRKIVVVNQSSGYLMVDIVNALADKYRDVVLICGSFEIGEIPLKPNIIRSKIVKYDKRNIFYRISTWLIGFIQIFWRLRQFKDFEVLYVTNPPISYFASLFFRQSFSILVYDIYPDVLSNIGLTDRHWLYKQWGKLNKYVFTKANLIFTISEGMKQTLTKYVIDSKIKVIPIWTHIERFGHIDKEKNLFLIEKNLQNKFLVLYSGNMGYTHDVDIMVDIAGLMTSYKDVLFIFIGDGLKKKILQEKVKRETLDNCLFFPWQPAEFIHYSLAAGDIGFVSLNEQTALASVPSKTFNLMASGVPILSISPKESELSYLLNKYSNGKNFERTDNLELIKEFILTLRNNPELYAQMSLNSKKGAEDFSVKNAQLFEKYLSQI